METTVNGSNNNDSKEISPEQLKQYIADLHDEMKSGKKLSTQVLSAAVTTSCIALGTSVALTAHHFFTKKR